MPLSIVMRSEGRTQKRRPAWRRASVIAAWAVLLALASGCASLPPGEGGGDPLEPVNRPIFRFNDALDKAVLKPVAEGYVKVTPKPVRTAVSNFFDNVGYLNVALNDFLQGKGRQGFADLGRFLVNSTVGVLGLFDIATGMGLEAHDEDFGQTLGVWGAEQGAYLVLPVLGPNSVRDAPGLVVSTLTNLLFYIGQSAVVIPLAALGAIDARARATGVFEFVDRTALERYVFIREAYRQRRIFLICDGNSPPRGLNDDLEAGQEEPASR